MRKYLNPIAVGLLSFLAVASHAASPDFSVTTEDLKKAALDLRHATRSESLGSHTQRSGQGLGVQQKLPEGDEQ